MKRIIELEYQAVKLKNTDKGKIVGRKLDLLYEKYPKLKEKIERMKQAVL